MRTEPLLTGSDYQNKRTGGSAFVGSTSRLTVVSFCGCGHERASRSEEIDSVTILSVDR